MTRLPRGALRYSDRVVVQLPPRLESWAGVDLDAFARAWAPGISVVVADMTSVVAWDARALARILDAHRMARSRQAELRLVVWSADLYAALQAAGTGTELPIYANIDVALRAQAAADWRSSQALG